MFVFEYIVVGLFREEALSAFIYELDFSVGFVF